MCSLRRPAVVLTKAGMSSLSHIEHPIIQEDHYYPFGLTMKGLGKEGSNPWKYNGKEEQDELDLGWYDYGARMYDAALGRWGSIDPLSDKYHSISPFAYVANNPIKFIDPDGRKIKFANGVSKKFKRQFAEAVQFLNENGAAGILAQLESSETIFLINQSEDGSFFDGETNTILWNPEQAILTDNLVELSPTTVLNHEADHGLQSDKNPDQLKKDKDIPDKDFGDKEEERVITGSEQDTARRLGEIEADEVTRTNHGGSLYPTTGPTSTELSITITPEKKPENEK